MAEEEQTALNDWKNQFNAAVQRRLSYVDDEGKSIKPATLRTEIIVELDIDPAVYDRWVAGTAFPTLEQHEALLLLLAHDGASSPAQLTALRMARNACVQEVHVSLRASRPARRQEAVRSNLTRHGVIREDLILRGLRKNKLRTPDGNIPEISYESMTEGDRKTIIANTQSAAEYLLCFRLNNYNSQAEAGNALGITSTDRLYRDWENGEYLPIVASLNNIRKRNFFCDGGDHKKYEKYEKLVIDNRRRLMAKVLRQQDTRRYSFGEYLRVMPVHFAFQELKNFLHPQPANDDIGQNQDATIEPAPTNLIISHGIYLHLLRHALGVIKLNIVSKRSGVGVSTIGSIEADKEGINTVDRKSPIRRRYEAYLEEDAIRDATALTAAEKAELTDLIRGARAKIDDLPSIRPEYKWEGAVRDEVGRGR